MDDPAEPLRRRPAVVELMREDLELYGVADLQERIEALEGEIQRSRDQIARKQSGRHAADALFSFSKDA